MANFDGYDDIIDSREIIERIEELADALAEGDFSQEDHDELSALTALRDDAESLADWHYGETLIHENYFTQAMKDDVVDCGYLPANLPWWIKDNIDWDGVADALKADYTDFTFRGAEYWARA